MRRRPPDRPRRRRGRASSAPSAGPASSSSGRRSGRASHPSWSLAGSLRDRLLVRPLAASSPTPLRFAVLVGFRGRRALSSSSRPSGSARPSRAAALARVEQATGALHRPATAFADRLAAGERRPGRRRRCGPPIARACSPPSTGSRPACPRPVSPGAIRARSGSWSRSSSSSPSSIAGSGALRAAREAFRGGETGERDDCPDRCLGDAAGLYQPGADLPHRRGGEAAGHAIFGAGRQRRHRAHRRRPRPRRGQRRRKHGETQAEVVADAADAAATGGDQPLERQVDARAGERRSSSARASARWRPGASPSSPTMPPRIAFAKPPGPDRERRAQPHLFARDDYGVVSGDAEIAPARPTPGGPAARPLIDGADDPAVAAAAAHPRRHRRDDPRPHLASLGRRQGAA